MRYLSVLLAPLVLACSLNVAVKAADAVLPDTKDDQTLNFLAIGDWGGVGSLFLGLLSTGWFHAIQQPAVAVGMAKVAEEVNAEFVVALGDNFYVKGIGGKHPYDRVQETFEDVYNDSSLQIPWYVIAGNHDHYGNVTDQVEYTKYSRERSQKDPNFVHRWEFPDLYHKQSIQKGNLTVDLILIDTVVLEDAFSNFWTKYILPNQLKMDQGLMHWKWLENALEESSRNGADYILVGGHYPVFNEGSHGPTQNLVDHLKPLLEKYRAHSLAGHDHAMMHFESENGSKVNYILTGTGNSCCSWRRPQHQKKHEKDHPDIPLKWHLFYQDNLKLRVKGGFVSMQATVEALKVKYHDHNGKVLYQAHPILPRTKQIGGASQQESGASGDEEVE